MLEWDLKPHMQWPGVMGNYGFRNENDRVSIKVSIKKYD